MLVGRIGRPHGVRVRSPSRCAPTTPTTASPSGRSWSPTRRARPADRRHRTGAAAAVTVLGFDGFADRTPPRSARTRCCWSRPAALPRAVDDPDEFYDHELVGLRRAARRRHGARRRRRRPARRRPATLLVVTARRRRRGPGPVRRARSCRGRRRRRARRRRPARRPVRPVSADAHRRRHDLPRVPRPAARVAARQGDRGAARSTSRVHDLRKWTTDVHRTVDDTPYGGGPGMVMRPEPWGRALDDVSAGAPTTTSGRADAGRAAVHPGAGRTSWPPSRLSGLRLRPLRGHRPAGGRSTPPGGCAVLEVSLGDYVLAGGEVAVLVDRRGGRPAAARSPRQRRIARRRTPSAPVTGCSRRPSYTRPAVWRGTCRCPTVLPSPAITRPSPGGAGRVAAPHRRPTGRTSWLRCRPGTGTRRPGGPRRAGCRWARGRGARFPELAPLWHNRAVAVRP